MSLKNKNIVISYYEVNYFIHLLNSSIGFLLKRELDTITSDLFGVSFENLWYDCDVIEKIEFIFLSRCYAYTLGWKLAQGSRLETFFKEQKVINFIKRTEHYIEARGKKIQINKDKTYTKQWVVIINKIDAYVLKEINDTEPEINEYYYNFTHAKTINEKENIVSGMWNQHFVNERKNMEEYPRENFNFDTLGRRVNAFGRHPKEKKDNSLRKKWDGWDDSRKKQELQELFWKMLIWKILNKKYNHE